MPIHVELCEGGKVLYFQVADPFSMDDLFKGFAKSTAFRDAIAKDDPTRHVHTLLDMMQTKTAPSGILQGRKMPALTHSIRGEIVVAVQNDYARSIATMMLKLMHADAHFTMTIDEAWDYLRDLIKTEKNS